MDTRYTYNYVLSFEGWAQCRAATDPDPSNAPRGVSGYSFALPGEPDLDRIIYFQDRKGVIQRSFCPDIGVRVTGGSWFRAEVVDGVNQVKYVDAPISIGPESVFSRAEVDLLGNPIFDSRNSTLVYNGYGLISPFNLQIKGEIKDHKINGRKIKHQRIKDQKIRISRAFYVDPKNPTNDLASIPIDQLSPYIMKVDVNDPPDPGDSTPGSSNILLKSGILDQVAYRKERLDNVEKELAETQKKNPSDEVCIAALNKRIAELRIDDPVNRRTAQLGAKVLVPYNLNSRDAVVNGKTIKSCGAPWNMEMWMGGWDTDAMSFFVLGTVKMVLDFDPFRK